MEMNLKLQVTEIVTTVTPSKKVKNKQLSTTISCIYIPESSYKY